MGVWMGGEEGQMSSRGEERGVEGGEGMGIGGVGQAVLYRSGKDIVGDT